MQKVEQCLLGPGEGGSGELLFYGYEVSIFQDEKSSGDGGGNDCTTV